MPFLSPSWLGFVLSFPFGIRREVYWRTIEHAFPSLWELPDKALLGLAHTSSRLRRWTRHQRRRATVLLSGLLRLRSPWTLRWANYIDYHEGIRVRDDLRTLVRDALTSLRRRGVVGWIDLEGLWRRHQLRARNHGDALTLLTALDLNLEVEEKGLRR